MEQEIQNREQMQKDIDALMRKYDRESNTRIWKGRPGLVVKGIMILFSLWCIYVTLFATFLEEIRLTSFLGVIILMGFLLYPAKKSLKMKANTMPPGDILFMVIGSGAFFYYAAQAEEIVNQGTHFTWLQIGIGRVFYDLCTQCRAHQSLFSRQGEVSGAEPLLYEGGDFLHSS